MTHNQIAYWDLVETKRSNRVREIENERHNRASEGIGWATVAESRRHNEAQENLLRLQTQNNYTIDMKRHDENVRHNLELESEAHRHNREGEENQLILGAMQYASKTRGITESLISIGEMRNAWLQASGMDLFATMGAESADKAVDWWNGLSTPQQSDLIKAGFLGFWRGLTGYNNQWQFMPYDLQQHINYGGN